ncbi:MAG: two-component regulator propeller domain-containing protein [Candidatus Krumholzibacteriota bacterium]
MNRKILLSAWVLITGTILCSCPAGADTEMAVKFHRLMLADGLTQSSIISTYQDSRGFIWMGTQDGLNRYDGNQIISYKSDPDDPSSLSDPNIWSIAEDANGDLWIGTEGGGFNRFNRQLENFTPYRYDPAQTGSLRYYNIKVLDIDEHGDVWLGTIGDGLLRFHPETETITAFTHDPDDPASLPSNQVQSLLIDSRGLIWIGTENGLTRFSPATGRMQHFTHRPQQDNSLAPGVVRSLSEGLDGRLWVGTSQGLCRFDPITENFELHVVDPSLEAVPPDLSISTVLEDPDGQVWIGSEHKGIYMLQPESGHCRRFLHNPQDPFSLSDNEIYGITMDRTGVIWIGTSNGANRLDTKAKQFFHVSNQAGNPASLSNACVWSVWETSSGKVWAVTESGLNIMDPESGTVKQIWADPTDPHFPSYDSFIEIFEEKNGLVWLGARDGALNRYDPATGIYTRFPARPGSPEGPDDDRVFSITADNHDKIWLGTMTGLECYDPRTNTFTTITHDPDNPAGLPKGSVRDLFLDDVGRIWMSVWGNGAAYLDPATMEFEHYEHLPEDRNSLSSNVVLSIFQDSEGRIWLGTSSGLNLLDTETGTCRWFTEREGLPNNTIYRIQEDTQGGLWLSTNYGLARFDPYTMEVKTYLRRDGIQDNEFNMGASHLGRSGKMYFGGINGFTVFYPDSIQHNPFIPAVVLTDFRLFNKPVQVGAGPEGRVILDRSISETDHIELSHRDHVISFEFSVLHFASPEKNNFSYRLEGFEDQWNDVGTRNHATYTNLPPGDYTFRVRGSNNDGVWNDEGVAVTLTVKPPFYRKAWFITGMVMLILGTTYGMHRYRMRLLDVKNKVLEQSVLTRTEDLTRANRHLQQEISVRKRIEDELREAKDNAEAATRAKSEFLANMSHEIRTPMNGVLGMTSIMLDTELTEDQRDYSEMIYASATNLLVIINDILDFSKIEAGKLKLERIEFDPCDVLDRVADMLAMKANKKGLNFRSRIAPNVPRTLRGDPGRLTQILINLTNNAVKFTDDGEVQIQVTLESQRKSWAVLRFEVTDTGVGIPADRLERIFGSFTQVDASITRQYGGTGLGLAIVKQLLDLMGGEIGVESIESEGANFWFTVGFPSERSRSISNRSERILVTHDDPETMVALAEQLAYLGYKGVVVEPDKAAQRLEAAARDESPFPVVLVGSCDGRKVARSMVARIRKVVGDDAPQFVLLCELGCVVDREDLEKDNLHSYLTVPVHHGKLEGVLGEITGQVPNHNSLAEFDSQVRNAVDAEVTGIDDPDGRGNARKTRILLAEDNPINQKVACLMLDKIGYQVDVAVNGYEVLDAVAQKDYAAILMDVQMPEMDGLEAARRIRAKDSSARDPLIPIIALTAHAMDQDRQRSLAAGMDDHASKPIDSETIAGILARHIGRPAPAAPPAALPAEDSPAKEVEPVHVVPTVRI